MRRNPLYSVVLVGLGLFLVYIVGDSIFDYFSNGKPLSLSTLITIPLLVMLFMQLKTWGFDTKAQKDNIYAKR